MCKKWEYCEMIFTEQSESYVNPGYESVSHPAAPKPSGKLYKSVLSPSLGEDYQYLLSDPYSDGFLPTDETFDCNLTGFKVNLASMGQQGWEIVNEDIDTQQISDQFGVHRKSHMRWRIMLKRSMEDYA